MPLTDRDYDLLSLYIDDALTPPERRAVDARLKTESELRSELEALKQTISLVKSMPELIAPRDLRLSPKVAADVLAEVAAQTQALRMRPTMLRLVSNFAAAAASLVLVLAGALTLLRPALTAPQSVSVAMQPTAIEMALEASAPGESLAQTATGKLPGDGTLGRVAPLDTSLGYATPDPDQDGTGGGAPDDFSATQPESDSAAGAMLYMAAPTGEPEVMGMLEPSATRTAIGFVPTQGSGGDSGSSAPAPLTQMNDSPATPAAVDETASRAFAAAPTGTPAPMATQAQSPENNTAESQEQTPPSQPPGTDAGEELRQETQVADAVTLDNENTQNALGDDLAAAGSVLEEPVSAPSSTFAGIAMVIAGIAVGLGARLLRRRKP